MEALTWRSLSFLVLQIAQKKHPFLSWQLNLIAFPPSVVIDNIKIQPWVEYQEHLIVDYNQCLPVTEHRVTVVGDLTNLISPFHTEEGC